MSAKQKKKYIPNKRKILHDIFLGTVIEPYLSKCSDTMCKKSHLEDLAREIFLIDDNGLLDYVSKKLKINHQLSNEFELYKTMAKSYGKSPEEECNVLDLVKQSILLSANNYKIAETIEGKYPRKNIFSVESFCPIRYTRSFLPRSKFKSFDIIDSETGYSYLLTPCPKNIYEAGDLFHLGIIQKINVFVSALSIGENGCCSDFWTDDALRSMPFRSGIQGDLGGPQTPGLIAKDGDFSSEKLKSDGTTLPCIRQKIIKFRIPGDPNPIIIKHLHFDNWKDGQICPNEDLVNDLIDLIEMNSIKPNSTRIQINCRHGKGRSVTILVCHLLRQKIRLHLSQGIPLQDIRVNIPELIFKFRNIRPDFLAHHQQMTNVYSITGKFCLKMQNIYTILKTNHSFSNKIISTILALL